MKRNSVYPILKLHPGEVVRIKSYEEICAAQGEDGTTEGLPFQTEMQKFCGLTFSVFRIVKKLIIENADTDLRGIRNTVILEGVICDGTAHSGCSRSCFLLWKEAWLMRAVYQREEGAQLDTRIVTHGGNFSQPPQSSAAPCQSISLITATYPLSRWSLKPYIWDITNNTSQLPRIFFCKAVSLGRRVWGSFGARRPNKLDSPQERTPYADFALQPGDAVEVKSLEEIRATLDSLGKNRGLAFTREMRRFCGQKLSVLKSVDQIIVEGSGEMRRISHTVILKGGNCDGSAYSSCRRNCYLLWRKVWLRKL